MTRLGKRLWASWRRRTCSDPEVLEVDSSKVRLERHSGTSGLLLRAIAETIGRNVTFDQVVSMDDLLLRYFSVHVNGIPPGRLIRIIVPPGYSFMVTQEFHLDSDLSREVFYLSRSIKGPYSSPVLEVSA